MLDEARWIAANIAELRERIQPRYGRSITEGDQIYCRWCFSDLATARAFCTWLLGRIRRLGRIRALAHRLWVVNERRSFASDGVSVAGR
jgi:hypothetical protein